MVVMTVSVVVVMVMMVVNEGLDLHVGGVVLESGFHGAGFVAWHPSIERKGLSGDGELRWRRVNAVFLDEVFVNGKDVSPVVSSPALGVFGSGKHGALNLASLGEERFQSLSGRATHVGNLDRLSAQLTQGHLDLGTFRRKAGNGHNTRGSSQFDLLQKCAKHVGGFAGFFGLSDVDFNTA